jgi:hypothetical protein
LRREWRGARVQIAINQRHLCIRCRIIVHWRSDIFKLEIAFRVARGVVLVRDASVDEEQQYQEQKCSGSFHDLALKRSMVF